MRGAARVGAPVLPVGGDWMALRGFDSGWPFELAEWSTECRPYGRFAVWRGWCEGRLSRRAAGAPSKTARANVAGRRLAGVGVVFLEKAFVAALALADFAGFPGQVELGVADLAGHGYGERDSDKVSVAHGGGGFAEGADLGDGAAFDELGADGAFEADFDFFGAHIHETTPLRDFSGAVDVDFRDAHHAVADSAFEYSGAEFDLLDVGDAGVGGDLVEYFGAGDGAGAELEADGAVHGLARKGAAYAAPLGIDNAVNGCGNAGIEFDFEGAEEVHGLDVLHVDGHALVVFGTAPVYEALALQHAVAEAAGKGVDGEAAVDLAGLHLEIFETKFFGFHADDGDFAGLSGAENAGLAAAFLGRGKGGQGEEEKRGGGCGGKG